MRTSTAGVDLIKKFEGVELAAYLCPAGKWTIGYGHTSDAGEPKVVAGMRVTLQEADAILRRDLQKFESEVARLVKVALSQGQFDALVSFHYNTGALGRSTLLRKLNSGNYGAVPAELMKWTRANGRELAGLVRRRRAECALWRGLERDAPIRPTEARLKPDAPQPRSIVKSKEGNAAALAGATSSVAFVGEVAAQAHSGAGLLQTLSDALGRPALIALLVVALASAAIWYWRKRHLEEGDA